MGAIFLDWLAADLRAAGLAVVEVDHVTSSGVIVEGPAWIRRARSSGGYAAAPLCVMWHHTAVGCGPSGPAGQIRDAITRPNAAPIMNLLVWCDAVVYVLAGGATNTNGKGWAMTFSRGTVPADGMNTRAVGMELANDGIGGVYPEAQIDAAFIVSNVVNARCGNRPDDLAGHAHYTNRKIDPATAAAVAGAWRPRSINTSGTWNLDDMRAEACRRAVYPEPAPNPEDDDMPIAAVYKPNDDEAGPWIWWDGQRCGWVRHVDWVPVGRVMGTYANATDGPLLNFTADQIRQMIESSWADSGPKPPGYGG